MRSHNGWAIYLWPKISLVVTEKLLQFEDDKTYVEVEIGAQEFEKRYITTGLSDGINIQIIDGITENDKIKSKMVPANEVKPIS